MKPRKASKARDKLSLLSGVIFFDLAPPQQCFLSENVNNTQIILWGNISPADAYQEDDDQEYYQCYYESYEEDQYQDEICIEENLCSTLTNILNPNYTR